MWLERIAQPAEDDAHHVLAERVAEGGARLVVIKHAADADSALRGSGLGPALCLLSVFSAFSARWISLEPASRSSCCSRRLASSLRTPRSGSAARSRRTASRRDSGITSAATPSALLGAPTRRLTKNAIAHGVKRTVGC